MKKVLLLGDSIRMGYDDFVKELLKDKCEVCYAAEDNGRFSAYTLWQMNQLFRQHGHFDVVHWNNGYWDMNIEAPMTEPIHPLDEYLHFLRRILAEIRCNGAQPIFATTTPVLSAGSAADISGTGADNIGYDNDRINQYNQAAKALMAFEGVPVNDLNALCLQDPYYYKCPDLLHLTEEGYRKCAAQTAACILKQLDME